jgi:ABC-type polysaccharide/polyol phosphate transport system, ATPase component
MAAVEFEHVSKHYRGAKQYRALRDDLAAATGRLVGIKRPARHVVRALDDLSLEIREGESFGLIGLNGAGKTTALKIASRITYPTTGKIRVRGRVGALIEVGTGMHPELTGRENIQLYGRILGLRAQDIRRRFDEIVEFAGVGHAVDQPVKQYSSGMQLRLGFSVAAHLEPDVLLVDEAIQVGDAGFQYRCVERMAELVRQGGTLVFVSHDMTAIETLCTRVVLLKDGRIALDGPAREVVAAYLRGVDEQRMEGLADRDVVAGEDFEIVRITVHAANGEEVDSVPADEPMTVRVHFVAHTPIRRPSFTIGFGDGRVGAFSSASMLIDGEAPELINGVGHVDCTFESLPLRPRMYEIWCGVRGEHGYGNLVRFQPLRMFEVAGELPVGKGALSWGLKTPVEIPYSWTTESGIPQMDVS